MTAITVLDRPCWTLVQADGTEVDYDDTEPHFHSEAHARQSAEFYRRDSEPLPAPREVDGRCATATMECGYRYDEDGDGNQCWPSADNLREHLIGDGYRPLPDGGMRCPARMGCDECDAIPDPPVAPTELPGQLALDGAAVTS